MHASGDSHHAKPHVKLYIAVFAVLAVLTLVTVAVSYLHLPIHQAVLVALTIATIKALLVAGFFMHLISEKQVITSILLLTLFFFMALMVIPVLSVRLS